MSKKQWLLIILLLFVVVAVFSAVLTVKLSKKTEPTDVFIPPAADKTAVKGLPDVEEGYRNFKTENFTAGLCGKLTQYDNGKIDVYFASAEDNEVLLKLLVWDENENTIGESGIIRPGEYVKTVTLSKPLDSKKEVYLRVISYNPENYYSMGVLSIKTEIDVP